MTVARLLIAAQCLPGAAFSAQRAVAQETTQTGAAQEKVPQSPQQPGRPLLVLDPAHGGADAGAALSPKLSEKEVTLSLARRLRTALEKQGFEVLMLRQDDASVSAEQRAERANDARAVLYIGLHAAARGSGGVYTATLTSSSRTVNLTSWEAAQAVHLSASRRLASVVADGLRKKKIALRESQAAVIPLRMLAMPAVALELAPDGEDAGELATADFQQSVAALLSSSIAAFVQRHYPRSGGGSAP